MSTMDSGQTCSTSRYSRRRRLHQPVGRQGEAQIELGLARHIPKFPLKWFEIGVIYRTVAGLPPLPDYRRRRCREEPLTRGTCFRNWSFSKWEH
ncbi:hypothetical protein AAHA92_00417 [Salvia divinorum]|uniref:Uncharacterized protein n=1 Tax=Salvia divinorum TaxID=28513 RepID=A0ABD1ILY1_SALDI